jgi:DDE superfamily endonuclease
MADTATSNFPASALVILLADSGFQGFELGTATLLIPCKKPRNQERPLHEQAWNTVLAKVRVRVEHALANVKTFRIVKDVIRLKQVATRDMVMEIACGLANLRLTFPRSAAA